MCGIAGVVNYPGSPACQEAFLRNAVAALRHRGPEDTGIHLDGGAGLAHARLSIVDLECGRQPIANEDETAWVVCNGEVFNYPELRRELLARGHTFRTGSDSEVIIHLYEEQGPGCAESLIGDFAFAVWDSRLQRLLLARDRAGVRPLYYTTALAGGLYFASEIKALFAEPRLPRSLDLAGLDQVFTYWSTLPGRTLFAGVQELPPGHVLIADGHGVRRQRYWQLAIEPDLPGLRAEEDYLEELKALLMDATRIRLRGDVPVGAYLSGGLDSSTIAAIVHGLDSSRMSTFSVSFADTAFDEREYQQIMARELGADHLALEVSNADVGEVFPDVVWHAETALLRTAPAPLLLLSRFVREHGLKVVLTGEGADEFLAGYDIFKEAKIRGFWARQPASTLRPRLLRRLYPYIEGLQGTPSAYLSAHFGQGLNEAADPFFSHHLRWRATRRLKRFFSPEVHDALTGCDHSEELAAALPGIGNTHDALARAQLIEAAIFLPQYLLSSQGDRVSLASAVEGRFPFLDHRLIEFCNRLPLSLKLRGLQEKYLLRRAARGLVPERILGRTKQPYRAPIAGAFLGPGAPEYVHDLLSPAAIDRAGYFNPSAVRALVSKAQRNGRLSEQESMVLTGILSVQLLDEQFLSAFGRRPERPPAGSLARA